MNSMIASARFTCGLFHLWATGRAARRYGSQLERLELYRRLAWLVAFAIGVCALLTYPIQAGAIEIFDRLENLAESRQDAWFVRIRDLVRPTFMILGTIEICWAAAIWVFERDTLTSFAVEVIKKIMTIGFFFVLLEHAPQWIPDILDTFEAVGADASGLGRGELSTDGILTMGIGVATSMWTGTRIFVLAAMAVPLQILGTTVPGVPALHQYASGVLLAATIGGILIVLAYVIVAAQFFCLKIESAILFAAGAIFLGMGSSTWTRDYVSKYLNYAINVGVRMLVLILILSLTLAPASRFGGAAIDMQPILEIVCVSVLQAILAVKAPELAGALLSGGAGLTAGGISGAGGGMMRTMASGALAAVNTAKGVGNLAKAANSSRSGAGLAQHAASSAQSMPAGPNTGSSSGSSIAGLSGGGSGGSGGAASGAGRSSSPLGALANVSGQGSGSSSSSSSNSGSGSGVSAHSQQSSSRPAQANIAQGNAGQTNAAPANTAQTNSGQTNAGQTDAGQTNTLQSATAAEDRPSLDDVQSNPNGTASSAAASSASFELSEAPMDSADGQHARRSTANLGLAGERSASPGTPSQLLPPSRGDSLRKGSAPPLASRPKTNLER